MNKIFIGAQLYKWSREKEEKEKHEGKHSKRVYEEQREAHREQCLAPRPLGSVALSPMNNKALALPMEHCILSVPSSPNPVFNKQAY